jgi:hypothetical protein
VKDELERIEIPGEHAARERAWAVVRTAFVERQPVSRPSRWPRVAAVAIALTALLAAALSPPGRAVVDEIREVVGVKRAQPALFSLPAPGQLLVAADSGVWVVQEDGSRRLLGEYREASWSPFGRFVVAARRNELAALEPDGDVRWTLPRRGVRSPRWTGTETDTRIAYVDRTGIRVVAGDGTDDRLLEPRAPGPLAWRTGAAFMLAYADRRGRIVLVDAASGKTMWRTEPEGPVSELQWSSDGRLLLARRVRARDDVAIYTGEGELSTGIRTPRGHVTAAAFRPDGHGSAAAIAERRQARLSVTGLPGPLLSGPGVFEDVAWSPDGHWLLVSWPLTDQWVFVRANGARRVRAVSNISDQFRSRSFPRIEGWCCAP